MSVLLLESSHINTLKHYVNKLQQQEFNLDGNVIITLFGINGATQVPIVSVVTHIIEMNTILI
jgi:hypothetical protein